MPSNSGNYIVHCSMNNQYRHYPKMNLWFPISVLILITWAISETDIDGLAALLAAVTIGVLCFIQLRRRQNKHFGPDVIVLGLTGCGVILSTAHLVLFERMNSLDPLPLRSADVSSLVFHALFLSFLGVVSFIVGYNVFPERLNRDLHRVSLRFPNECPRLTWRLAVAILSAIGIWSSVNFITNNGGIVTIISTWNDRDSVESAPSLLMYALPLSSLLFLAGAKKQLQWPVFAHLAISIFFLSITGSRNDSIRLLLSSAIILWYSPPARARLQPHGRLLFVLLTCGILAYVFIIGGVRQQVEEQDVTSPGFIDAVGNQIYAGGILENILSGEYLPSTKRVAQVIAVFPTGEPFLEGDSFLAALDTWVPAFIWSDFPSTNIGQMLYHEVYSSSWDSALFVNFVGELYANWGTIAVPIGMFLLGIVCKIVLRIFLDHIDDLWIKTWYASFVGMFLPFLLQVESSHASYYSVMYFYLLIPFFMLAKMESIALRSHILRPIARFKE